jgi:hypothetical protein
MHRLLLHTEARRIHILQGQHSLPTSRCQPPYQTKKTIPPPNLHHRTPHSHGSLPALYHPKERRQRRNHIPQSQRKRVGVSLQSHRPTSTPPTTPQATASNTPLPILPELLSYQRHIQHGNKHSPSRSHCHRTGQPWHSTARNQHTVPSSRWSHSPLVRQYRLQLHPTTWSLEIRRNAPAPPHLGQPTCETLRQEIDFQRQQLVQLRLHHPVQQLLSIFLLHCRIVKRRLWCTTCTIFDILLQSGGRDHWLEYRW